MEREDIATYRAMSPGDALRRRVLGGARRIRDAAARSSLHVTDSSRPAGDRAPVALAVRDQQEQLAMPDAPFDTGPMWNANADAWTQLARAGYDVYRDHLNTPAFLALLPDVKGLHGVDLGCGEGHNTRLLAQRGARMQAIDVAATFIAHARQAETEQPLGIDYRVADAMALPFADGSFDFATAFMSLMDVPDHARALAECHRTLRPGGFLQFSINHPCFSTPHRRNLRGGDGLTRAFEVGDYFQRLTGEVEEWIFGSAPAELRQSLPRFRIPRFTRTLSDWLNLLLDTGFAIERLAEPRPDDATVRRCPAIQDAQVVAYFLIVRGRKAG